MTILINKLCFYGEGYPTAEIKFGCKDHLVFGPTDTGKTYIVEILKFLLGGKPKYLRDIGYSDRYTESSIQIMINENQYTIFRDLSGRRNDVYNGFLDARVGSEKIKENANDFILNSLKAKQYEILVKAGKLGAITSSDFRRVSLFSENDTLSLDFFEGNDSNILVRNRAAFSVFLTGKDDKELDLVLSTDKRNEALGRVSLIEEQMLEIKNILPDDIFNRNLTDELDNLENEVEKIKNIEYDINLKLEENRVNYIYNQDVFNKLNFELNRNIECRDNFIILKDKLKNDYDRLETLSSFSDLSKHYRRISCPVCQNEIKDDGSILYLSEASKNESYKINYHLTQVNMSINDIDRHICEVRNKINSIESEIKCLEMEFNNICNDKKVSIGDKLVDIYDLRTDLIQWSRDKEQYLRLDKLLIDNKENSKQKKQIVNRDFGNRSSEIINRVKSLLNTWCVPDVDTIGMDEKVIDITINGRARKSYGKGKRGIFLSAYIISIMENAIENNTPHLGFVIIDSPVVTYKDPKHSVNATEEDDLLQSTVKDRFYNWLLTRENDGQIIVLENEEPDKKWESSAKVTEFTGNKLGRWGLFPSFDADNI